jgi:uncharacterized protein YvpB
MSQKNQKQKLSKFSLILRTAAGVILIFVVLAVILVTLAPRPSFSMQKVSDKVKIDSELRLSFTLPVAREVNVELTPKTFGEVRYENEIWNGHLSRAVIFRPEVTWLPGTTYELRVSEVKSALPSLRAPREFVFAFTTEDLPSIVSVTPATADKIRADTAWQVKLDKANNQLVDYEFRLSPDIELGAVLSEDKTMYTLTPAAALSQGQEYTLDILQGNIRHIFGTETIARQEEGQSVWQGKWQIREAPGLEEFKPQGQGVGLKQKIEITFSENVDFDSFKSSVSISPEAKGQWQTSDYKTMTFVPAGFTEDTTYTVVLKKGLKTYNGGYLEEESSHSFSTIGPIKVSQFSPADQSQGFGVSNSLRLTFNQEVDHVSAESKFEISPSSEGNFQWDGLTMIFQPKTPLAFSTSYTVTIKKGVAGPSGYVSKEDQTTRFTTELSVTKLAVPFHRQEHNLSCEVATLVMALAYRGVNVSEETLIGAIGFEPIPKKDGVWGNPHIAFVGDIDGHQPSSGYGVYWQPIATAAQKYRTARWFTGGKLSDITAEIKKGNPVIFWGTAGSGSRIDWKTSDGGNVIAVNGEHTRVVVGFIGSADNPTKIITLDPLSGEKYFTQSAFLANWAVLGNSGVVVE